MATPEIGEAIEASDKFVMDEMEYRKYLQRESAIWDYNTDMRGSWQQGHDEGVEKKACEMVDEMLAEKFPLSQIAKISKWPLEKVEAYAKERHHEQ